MVEFSVKHLVDLPAGLLVFNPSLWVRAVQMLRVQAAAGIGCRGECVWRVKSSGSKVT